VNDLTKAEMQQMVDEFVAEARDDLVGLWEIVGRVEREIADQEAIREPTLMVVRALLARGLLAGDPPYSTNGFRLWNDQEPEAVINRIRKECLALGRVPNMPDIVWFSRP
jgi:hypothetical protein